MKFGFHNKKGRGSSGMTLVEIMVAVALGSLVMAIVVTVFVSSLINFAGLGNYAQLTGQSRLSLDKISREIREATDVVAFQTNLPVRSLTLTNEIRNIGVRLAWDADTKILTMEKTGEAAATFLTGCEDWDFSFYQRTPRTAWTFYPTTDYRICKLINMHWKCSRRILGDRINTETIVTAQVVLRNKTK